MARGRMKGDVSLTTFVQCVSSDLQEIEVSDEECNRLALVGAAYERNRNVLLGDNDELRKQTIERAKSHVEVTPELLDEVRKRFPAVVAKQFEENSISPTLRKKVVDVVKQYLEIAALHNETNETAA